jgi:hypothetical protein
LRWLIEEVFQIGVHNPVHAPLGNTKSQRIQRIVLAALRSEPVAKSQKVYLVNRIEHFHYGTLHDLVFQRSDSQWTLSPICFGNVLPLRGQARYAPR